MHGLPELCGSLILKLDVKHLARTPVGRHTGSLAAGGISLVGRQPPEESKLDVVEGG